jgi:hypothetical protein
LAEDIRFNIGDLVRVSEYDNMLFEITGYIHETMVMYGESSEETYFSLRSIGGNYILQKTADNMTYVRSPIDKDKTKDITNGIIVRVLDDILDKYNDLMYLYQETNDDYFLKRANEIVAELKEYYRRRNGE